jgi:hypothetical protein
MAEGATTCPVCGVKLAAPVRFCGNCGASVVDPVNAAPAAPIASATRPNATILGLDEHTAGALAQAQQRMREVESTLRSGEGAASTDKRAGGDAAGRTQAASNPGRDRPLNKTMIGGAPPSAAEAPAPAGAGSGFNKTMIGGAPPSAAEAPGRDRPLNKTMIGGAPPSAAETPAPAGAGSAFSKTMIGDAPPSAAEISASNDPNRDRPLNETMIGASPPSAAEAPAPSRAAANFGAEPPRRGAPAARSVDLNRTMLGVASPLLSSAQPLAAEPSAPGDGSNQLDAGSPETLDRDDATPLPVGSRFGLTQPKIGSATQLGAGAASPLRAAGPASAAEPSLSARQRLDARTMLGLRAPEQSSRAGATEQASGLPPEFTSGQAGPGTPGEILPGARLNSSTLLGLQRGSHSSAPAADGGDSGRPLAFGGGGHGGVGGHSIKHGRTMLGVPLPGLSSLPPSPIPSEPPPPEPDEASIVPPLDPPSVRPSFEPAPPVRSRAPLLIAALVLMALAAMVYVRLGARRNGVEVSARIVTSDSGESLVFDAPRAPTGSRLRFGGQEQPLALGRASFALAADSLRVGDNIVLADVVAPSGETTSARITLAVSFRIAVDTAGLRAESPSLAVVVTAVPGTRITLEGQPLALDAQGHGSQNFPIDVVHELKGGMIDHVVHYRIQPPTGDAVVDQLHTQIPVAVLQIDRPGRDVITDRDSLEIAGAVGRDTQVVIDGAPVPVKEQRFVSRLSLPKSGDYAPRIVASAAGKAPFGVTLNIKRVHDLQQAAKEFVPTAGLNYSKVAANPEQYRGAQVSFEGRVYASDSRAGSGVIQMLVRPCPSTQRCSLWVVDPQAGEVAVDRWVRVLGVVDGIQQFRSEKNVIVSVPKVVARFVLPLHPEH